MLKEQIINNIVMQCQSQLDTDQLKYLYNVLHKEFHSIEIVESTYEVGFIDESFENAVKMFCVSKKIKNCSHGTIECYLGTLKKFRTYIDKPLNRIDSIDIKYYLGTIMGEMSLVSVNNNKRALSSFFSWCHGEGYIAKNPMANIENIKTPQQIKETFSPAEIEQMHNYFNSQKRDGLRNRALMEFLYSTGCRVGEVSSVDIKDVDFSTRAALVYGEKSKKYRTVYLTELSLYYLKEYLATRKDSNEALFVSSRAPYNRLSREAIEDVFLKCGNDLGFKCNPHKFRRTVATDMINRGAEVGSIQKMLGHSDSSTTLTYYADVKDSTVKNAHDKFVN